MAVDPILVLGATGGQGGAVIDALLDRGAPVRALVRDPASSGARRSLDGPGYQVDIPALHAMHPDLSWTSFADWARSTF